VSEEYKLGSARGRELASLRGIWVCLLFMGIGLIILGAFAISSALIATLATTLVFGILLLLGAVFQIGTAFWGRSWRGFFLHLLAGALYLIVGMFMIENPVEAALGLTLVVAAYLLVGGILRIVLSVVERFDGWGWVLLNGVVTLVLGVMIWRAWPASSLVVIGIFVGIDMLFAGWSWIMTALAVRSVPARPV
jgi:uncharacterized membrane protein HdeD (DUF308 family)